MHHKSLNTRTLLLAVSLGISALAAPVTAQEFRLQGFLEGDYPGPGGPPCTLDVQELSNSPVSSSNSCSGPNFYSSGVIHMLASRGVISADLELTRCCGGYAKYETDKNISAPSVYFPGPSDLVFTGPQGATHVEISYSMDYSFETDSAIDFENMGGITGNVGGAIINWQLSRPSTSCGVYMSESGRLQSSTVVVPLNTPVNYGFFVSSKVLAASPDTRRTSITVHFASDRSGVFNLPDGYTANSPSLNIVDNVWIPPCAADLNGDGSLNFFDVSLFLSLFSTHDAQADLAPPTGQWDFFDVMAYLEAFSDGCP